MKKFIEIFTGLERAHGCTYVEKKNTDGTKVKGQSFVKRQHVDEELWSNHLKGIEPSLGIIPINEENKCRWGCIDIDSYAGFDHKKLIIQIKKFKLPLITFRSKSGGAHIFLFTTVPVDAELIRKKLVSIGSILGFGSSEVFPKQIELKSKDDTGNFLNLPYFNATNTTRYAFLENGEAASIDGFFGLYERNKLTPEQLEKLIIKRTESELSDGPPCMETLAAEGISEGGRDNALFHYTVYAKKKWPSEWKNKIILFNEKVMKPPLDDASVERIKEQHDKKEWGYKCKDEPMCSFCDKELCRTRKYGIGGMALFPVLSDLQKIELDEPYYYVNVDGQRVKLDNVETLLEQRLFQRAVAKQIDKRPPRISPKEFGQYTDLLLAGIEKVPAPAGSSKIDQLQEHLEEFCTNRSSTTTTKEDISRGNVYTSEGKHYFIFSKFFYGFLQKRKWDEKSQVTQQMLKDHFDCIDDRIMVGKKKVSVMCIISFDRIEDSYKPKQFKPKDPY
tara:strand:- start:3166 stop:4677 length:1512 start_codon:yes stop_codon:yes gene_type:complete